MRALPHTGAWSATSSSWSTTRATLRASTGCAASSAGSATVPAVPTGLCASLRSSSSSRPSPWASSSGPDTSTTTSVGPQLGSVSLYRMCAARLSAYCAVSPPRYAFPNVMQICNQGKLMERVIKRSPPCPPHNPRRAQNAPRICHSPPFSRSLSFLHDVSLRFCRHHKQCAQQSGKNVTRRSL